MIDPIVEEIHKIREEYAKKFKFDMMQCLKICAKNNRKANTKSFRLQKIKKSRGM